MKELPALLFIIDDWSQGSGETGWLGLLPIPQMPSVALRSPNTGIGEARRKSMSVVRGKM